MTRTVTVRGVRDEANIGRVLDGRWKIEDRLRKGGMGEIYLGRQLSIERKVAIKLMREDFGQEARLMTRFFREARALSSLHHPNIVTMFDFGQDDATQSLYMVMELLRGRSMADYIASGKEEFTLAAILRVMSQLASALVEVHAQGVVHRDLKPDNLFLEETSGGLHLKLLDFGIAILDEPAMDRLTKTGQLQGTPHYMAPEQIEGLATTPRTDLYAFGVILYQLLSGSTPFVAQETMMGVLQSQLTEAPEPLAQSWGLSEPVHEPLVALVEQLMAKDAIERPRDASIVCSQLKAFLQEMPDVAQAPVLRVQGHVPGHLDRPAPFPRAVISASLTKPSITAPHEDSMEGWIIPEAAAPDVQQTPVVQIAIAAVIAMMVLGLLLVWYSSEPPNAAQPIAAPTTSSVEEPAAKAPEPRGEAPKEEVAPKEVAPKESDAKEVAPVTEVEPTPEAEPAVVADPQAKDGARKRTPGGTRTARPAGGKELKKLLNDMRSP